MKNLKDIVKTLIVIGLLLFGNNAIAESIILKNDLGKEFAVFAGNDFAISGTIIGQVIRSGSEPTLIGCVFGGLLGHTIDDENRQNVSVVAAEEGLVNPDSCSQN